MNAKNILLSILTLASVLLLTAGVSAADVADNVHVKVDGVYVAVYLGGSTTPISNVALVAGDRVTVEVIFTAVENDTDVTLEVELEGQKADTEASSTSFDVIEGHRYTKSVVIDVPFELKDDLSDDLTLNVKLNGKDYETELDDVVLLVQRPSYNPEIKSLVVSSNVDAGETFPVDIVLKNMGYNDLDDLYVTVSIPSLGVQKTSYFGDLANIERCSDDDCDEDDTVSGRIYLETPYSVQSGSYTMQVTVENDDVRLTKTAQVAISNTVAQNVIVSNARQTVEEGEQATFSLLLVNPTNQFQIYTLTSESGSGYSSSVAESTVAVPAGSTMTVRVFATGSEDGTYTFNVNVLSNGQLVSSQPLTLEVKGNDGLSDPLVILTVILAVIFVVLLIVLIVLVSKKPKKSEEFGESYY